jgi:NADH dehydrogenase
MTIDRVTVFGGDGFVGRYVVRRLLLSGSRVIVFGRHASAAGFLGPMGVPGQILAIDGDVRDGRAVAAATAGSAAVINLVGILHQRGREDFLALHRDAARHIAAAAALSGAARFVHISAIGADTASPSAYARSKALGEAAIREAFPDATVLRPSIVFGAEDKFFNRFAAMAAISPVLPIVGADTRFQPVYVDDVAAAAVAALERPEARGAIYELGGPAIYSFRELIALMLRETRRRCLIVDLPPAIAGLVAAATSFLPDPPLTHDQIRLLGRDNIVAPGAKTLATLGLAATPLEILLPRLLARFRRPA